MARQGASTWPRKTILRGREEVKVGGHGACTCHADASVLKLLCCAWLSLLYSALNTCFMPASAQGLLLSVLTGMLGGSVLVPLKLSESTGLSFLPSFGVGAILAASLIATVAVKGGTAKTPPGDAIVATAAAGIFSGCLWNCGNILSAYATGQAQSMSHIRVIWVICALQSRLDDSSRFGDFNYLMCRKNRLFLGVSPLPVRLACLRHMGHLPLRRV